LPEEAARVSPELNIFSAGPLPSFTNTHSVQLIIFLEIFDKQYTGKIDLRSLGTKF